MADYTSRIVTESKLQFSVPLPTNWVEVEKMMHALAGDYRVGDTDDAVEVTSDGEYLYMSAKVPNP